MEQREIEILRIGFLKGIECMENHAEDDDYDDIYFDSALDEAEKLAIPDATDSVCKHHKTCCYPLEENQTCKPSKGCFQ